MSERRGFFGALQRVMARVTTPQPVSSWLVPTGGRIPGVRLNDWRQALQIPAVYRCVSLVSQSIAMLPWGVHKKGADGARENLPDHPVDWLLRSEPNEEMTAYTWRQTITIHALMQGNGYAEIQRNRRGTPEALWLIDDPDRVTPGRDADGKIAYKVMQAGGDSVVIPARDMYHVHGLGTDGIVGLGLMEVALRSLLVNMALDEVAKTYFVQGMRTPGFIKTKGKMGIDALKSVIKMIREEFTGLRNFEMPIPLDNDMEFQPAGSNLHDAQFLDLRKFGVLDICRWFGVPPHLVYDLDKATFSNIESQDLTFLKYGLLPRIVPMEQEANRKLLGSNYGGLYSRMNVNAFARGDMAARITYYQGMRNMGVFTVNQILELEDESTIGTEGDVRTMQTQYQPTSAKPADTAPTETPPAIPAPAALKRLNGAAH